MGMCVKNPLSRSFHALSLFCQGFASGNLFTDNVTVGGYNVSFQGFAVCDQLSNGLLSGNVSGLMGED
jgi:hypothetical protein